MSYNLQGTKTGAHSGLPAPLRAHLRELYCRGTFEGTFSCTQENLISLHVEEPKGHCISYVFSTGRTPIRALNLACSCTGDPKGHCITYFPLEATYQCTLSCYVAAPEGTSSHLLPHKGTLEGTLLHFTKHRSTPEGAFAIFHDLLNHVGTGVEAVLQDHQCSQLINSFPRTKSVFTAYIQYECTPCRSRINFCLFYFLFETLFPSRIILIQSSSDVTQRFIFHLLKMFTS